MVSHKSRPIHKIKHNESGESAAEHGRHPHKKPSGNETMWMVASVVLAILVVVSIFTGGFKFNKLESAKSSLNSLLSQDINEEAKLSIKEALSSLDAASALIETKQEYSGQRVKLEFYVMSQCPYGTQVEDAVKPALDKLGDAVDFRLDFISTDLGDGTFRSLHGEPETQGNIVQLCAVKYEPDKYMDMIICMNKNAGSIPNNWEACARENSLNVQKIKSCYEGQEGKTLLSESIKRSQAANAQGSPTMFINGQPYNGGRDTLSFMRALCANLEGHLECASMPACAQDTDCVAQPDKIGKCENPGTGNAKCSYSEPNPVNLIIINDKQCLECQGIESLVGQLRTLFKGLKVTEYDFEDPEAKKIVESASVKFLPAFLFDETVKDGENYENMQRWLSPAGKYISLNIGASHDPLKEVCDNGVDDRDNDGLVDCADPDCSSEWKCMEKLDKPVIELFVMSHCPYGTQMEKGILPAVELLGEKIDFNLRFVYYAMHGKVEIDEQAAQYCIQKEQEDKLLPYLKCFLQEGNSQACLDEVKIDKAKLDACAKKADADFGLTASFNDQSTWLSGRYPLFNVDKALNEKYSVGGSPTLVINGVVASVARDPASLLDAICTGFKNKPAECSQQLSASAYSAGFGFAAAPAGQNTAAGACG